MQVTPASEERRVQLFHLLNSDPAREQFVETVNYLTSGSGMNVWLLRRGGKIIRVTGEARIDVYHRAVFVAVAGRKAPVMLWPGQAVRIILREKG